MKASLQSIRKKRFFSEEFKKHIVKEFESGQYSVLQLEKLFKVNNKSIYQWIYKYSTFNEQSFRIIEMEESSSKKLKSLEGQVRELQQAVGMKQMYIDYLEKMMDIAKDELNIDIRKNYGTPQSTTSESTKKK